MKLAVRRRSTSTNWETVQRFGLSINQSALVDLNRIRTDVEHFFTPLSDKTVREAIAKALPLAIDLFRLAKDELRDMLGNTWKALLDVRSVYERELAECRRTFRECRMDFDGNGIGGDSLSRMRFSFGRTRG